MSNPSVRREPAVFNATEDLIQKTFATSGEVRP